MAKVLEGNVDELFARTREGRYPWDEWLDGQPRELEKGVDFDCSSDSLRNAFYGAAKERGLKAKTKELDNGNVRAIAVKVSGNGAPKTPAKKANGK